MRLGATALLTVLLAGGCNVRIQGIRNDEVDAAVADAATVDVDAPLPPPTDAMHTQRCANRAVYLNFSGQQLLAGPSDATTNHAGWMTIAQGAAPPYLSNNPNRLAAINTIVTGVRTALSQFPVSVVTDRPTTGNYMMIVYGGQPGNVGSQFTSAVNQLDCGDARPNDVAWLSDAVSPPQLVINFTLGAIGFGLGMTATGDAQDCLCGWANGCQPNTSVQCRLGSPIARDTGATQQCPGASPSQDEVAAIRAAFCG
jgi:hypothetical protein